MDSVCEPIVDIFQTIDFVVALVYTLVALGSIVVNKDVYLQSKQNAVYLFQFNVIKLLQLSHSPCCKVCKLKLLLSISWFEILIVSVLVFLSNDLYFMFF